MTHRGLLGVKHQDSQLISAFPTHSTLFSPISPILNGGMCINFYLWSEYILFRPDMTHRGLLGVKHQDSQLISAFPVHSTSFPPHTSPNKNCEISGNDFDL